MVDIAQRAYYMTGRINLAANETELGALREQARGTLNHFITLASRDVQGGNMDLITTNSASETVSPSVDTDPGE